MTLTPGSAGLADVGGRYTAEVGAFHGKSGTKVSFDGMGMENSDGNSSYQLNSAVVAEMTAQNERDLGRGQRRRPGHRTSSPGRRGTSSTSRRPVCSPTSKLESSNLTDELRSRGVTDVNQTMNSYDETLSAGGPIERDKIWFFGAFRTWGFSRAGAGAYWNKTQNVELTPPGAERVVVLWTPWVDRPLNETSGRHEW